MTVTWWTFTVTVVPAFPLSLCAAVSLSMPSSLSPAQSKYFQTKKITPASPEIVSLSPDKIWQWHQKLKIYEACKPENCFEDLRKRLGIVLILCLKLRFDISHNTFFYINSIYSVLTLPTPAPLKNSYNEWFSMINYRKLDANSFINKKTNIYTWSVPFISINSSPWCMPARAAGLPSMQDNTICDFN